MKKWKGGEDNKSLFGEFMVQGNELEKKKETTASQRQGVTHLSGIY